MATSYTFADLVARPNNSVMWYAHVSGLPYIFGSLPLPPEWDIGGGKVALGVAGEEYTWSTTLMMDSDTVQVQQRAEPKAGLGTCGTLPLKFKLRGNQVGAGSDVWLSLLSTHPFRTDSNLARITSDVLPTADTIPCDSLAGWPPSLDAGQEIVYMGHETARYGQVSGSNLIAVVRGRYGSQALHHRADLDGLVETGGGTLIARHPLVIEGRIVTLYLALGRSDGYDGQFVPYSVGPGREDSIQVYRGIVSQWKWGSDLLHVQLDTLSLESLLQKQIATRLPRAYAGNPATARKSIYVAGDRNKLSFGWSWGDVSVPGLNYGGREAAAIPLRPHGSVSLAAGTYREDEIARAIAWSCFTYSPTRVMPPQGNTTDPNMTCNLSMGTDGKFTLTIRLVNSPSAAYTEDTHFLINATPPDSFWRVLGFEGSKSFSANVSAPTMTWTCVADRPAPQFYLPKYKGIGAKLTLHGLKGPAFQADLGYKTDEGENITTGYLKIGEEIVGFEGSLNALSTDWYEVSIVERGAFGSKMQEHYVEVADEGKSQELTDVTQGLGFPNVGVFRMMLYLMLGGSGVDGHNSFEYDKGWYGTGAFLPASLIDVDGIDALNAEVGELRDNHFFAEPTSLAQIFAPELVVCQTYLAPGRDTDGAWRLRVYRVHPPLEYEGVVDAFPLDDSTTTITGGGTGLDTEEGKVINVVLIKGGYDHGTGRFRFEERFYDGTSIATYGRKPAIEIELKGISNSQDFQTISKGYAERIFSNFARPYSIIQKQVTTARFWTVEMGDLASITDPRLPRIADGQLSDLTPGRGVSSLPARVYVKTDVYPSGERTAEEDIRGVVAVISGGLGEGRVSGFAPAAYGSAVSSAQITCADHEYSASGGTKDWQWFQPGESVRVYKPGNESTAVTRTILTVSAGVITCDSAIGLTAPVIVEPASYQLGTTYQRSFVYVSDGDGKLDKSSGSDRCFRYL